MVTGRKYSAKTRCFTAVIFDPVTEIMSSLPRCNHQTIRVKPGFIGRQGSSDRSFYVSFTALPTDTCSERSYPFVFATNLLSDTALKICIARVITP